MCIIYNNHDIIINRGFGINKSLTLEIQIGEYLKIKF